MAPSNPEDDSNNIVICSPKFNPPKSISEIQTKCPWTEETRTTFYISLIVQGISGPTQITDSVESGVRNRVGYIRVSLDEDHRLDRSSLGNLFGDAWVLTRVTAFF